MRYLRSDSCAIDTSKNVIKRS